MIQVETQIQIQRIDSKQYRGDRTIDITIGTAVNFEQHTKLHTI